MPGLCDLAAQALLNDATGALPAPPVGARYLTLFSAAPTSPNGTGGTELSGTGYARVRYAAATAATAAFTTSSTVIPISSTPAVIAALGTPAQPAFGAMVWDTQLPSGGALIGYVQSCVGTTLTLQAASLRNSQGTTDNLTIYAFPLAAPSSGAQPLVAPASVANSSQINFPQAGSNWGTAIAWGIFDAATAGNCWYWDYLGSSPWRPGYVNTQSPATLTVPRHGYVVGTPLAMTAKAGGNFPSFSQSNFTNNVGTLLVSQVVSVDTFRMQNAGVTVNSSSTGDFMVRAITPQAIPQNVTAQFPPGAFVIYAA